MDWKVVGILVFLTLLLQPLACGVVTAGDVIRRMRGFWRVVLFSVAVAFAVSDATATAIVTPILWRGAELGKAALIAYPMLLVASMLFYIACNLVMVRQIRQRRESGR